MIEVFVEYSNFGHDCKIFIIDKQPGSRKILSLDDGKWRADEIEESSYLKPTLYFPSRMGREVIQAMAEAFSKEGIKTENDHKIQGTLEAQKYHLEDLRTLLKIDKRPERTR